MFQQDFSVKERKEWMVGRKTREEEDMAYSLIGIFGVSMEFRYGEGKERALSRLEEEIGKVNTTPFIVPFDRNPRFVGRESQLDELEGKLFVQASTAKVAITGPGGVGKSQLALELAYRVRQEYKNCSVFWVSAKNLDSLHQAYTTIAQQLNIPGYDDEKMDVKKLVQVYLSKDSAGQWLLVFDNADVESAGSPKVVSLIECLPSSEQGAIVFTTTDKQTAVTLVLQDVVDLPEMEQEIAQRMLGNHLISPTNEQEVADLLLKELAYLPLAIVQAAAYVNINKITIQR